MINDLIGAFGGKKQKEPVRTRDTLIADDYVEVILGLGEGPWQGLVPGTAPDRPLQNFFLDATPLQNAATGTSNFQDFNVAIFNGEPTDGPVVPKLGGISSNMTVNVRLSQGTEVIRQTPASMRGSINQLEFRILFNQLVLQNNNGTFETTAQFAISYKLSTSPTWLYYQGETVSSIKGKTTNGTPKDFVIDVPLQSTADYDVRVTKISEDNGTENIIEMTWESLQMTTLGPKSYSNLALAHLHGKASNQFTSIPEFSGIYDGQIIKVPTNYNPISRTYDETTPWNGTFKEAYSNNSAWALYDALTNVRYGMAKYYKNIAANRYEFYAAAKWCDEMVSDGKGGVQPRFTHNDLITDLRPGTEALIYMAGSFNSVIYDDNNGLVRLKTDQYREPDQIFTPQNISKAGFSYTFTDITTRINDVTAAFVNPDMNWEEDRRPANLDTTAWKEANGIIPEEFTAVGCIDVHEALRRANYRLLTANTEVTNVSFVTSRFGVMTEIFNPIYVCDPEAGWSNPGRIKSVSGNIIYLRDPLYLSDLSPITLKIQIYTGVLETVSIPSVTGAVYSLTVNEGVLPAELPDRTVFTAENGSTLGFAKPFKVLSITPVDGSPDEYQISAIEINVNKYSDADANTISDPVVYSERKPGVPFQPTNLTAESGTKHLQITNDGQLLPRIYVSWARPARSYIDYYEVEYQLSNSGVWTTEKVFGEFIYLSDVMAGFPYDIKVVSVSSLNNRSLPVAVMGHYVVGKEAPPPDVTGLNVSGLVVSWDEISRKLVPDLKGYLLRFQYGSNTNWGTATPLHMGFLTDSPYTLQVRPSGPITIMAKALDTSDKDSNVAASVTGDLGFFSVANIVQSVDFDPLFPGTYENCTLVDGELLATALDSFYGTDTDPFYGPDAESFYDVTTSFHPMVYTTDEVVVTEVVTGSVVTLDLIADGIAVVTEYREYDLVTPKEWRTWRGQAKLGNGSYQFRVTITSGSTRGRLIGMHLIVDAPDRAEVMSNVTIAIGGTTVPYTLTDLSVIKSVQVQLNSNGVGALTTLVDYTVPLSPKIFAYNTAGTTVGGATCSITMEAY